MGYTHHKGISLTDEGLAVGAAGSESVVMNSAGDITVVGTLTGSAGTSYDTSHAVVSILLAPAAAAAQTVYFTSPYACDIAAVCNFGVSSGTGRTVSVVHGSAGDNAFATTSTGVTGTVGVAVTMTASALPSATSGEILSITSTTCATAQEFGVTLTLTKT